MTPKDYFKAAFIGLKTNRTRSLLSVLGIVIGISSVIMMVSIGEGAQNAILSEIENLGSNLIIITPGTKEEGQRPSQMMVSSLLVKSLTYNDVKALLKKSNVPYAKNVVPFAVGQCNVSYGSETCSTNFIGTTPAVQEVMSMRPQAGRFFSEEEGKGMAKVVVLGLTPKEKIFGDEDPMGKMVKINRINFKVIGLMEELGVTGMDDQDDQVLIPLTTAQSQLKGDEYINNIIVQAEEEYLIDQTVVDIEATLRERHNISDPAKDNFIINTQKEITKTLAVVTGILTIFLSCVAAIALVVGGIGIMNIMLVSVSERTHEIGLRKAVGAREKDILYQFLTEAIILTVSGGIVGIIFGLLGSYLSGIIIGKAIKLEWQFSFSLVSVFLAFFVSTIIGLAFGIYPAQKAAKLDPIEALRYE